MTEPYVKTTWINDETKANQGNMNKIEDGIKDVTDGLIEHEANNATEFEIT